MNGIRNERIQCQNSIVAKNWNAHFGICMWQFPAFEHRWSSISKDCWSLLIRPVTRSPQVAAMAATLIGLAETTLRRLEQGDLKRLMIDAEEGTMVVYPANRASLAVLVEKGTKLGRVLYAVSQVRDNVMEILELKED
jgi:predicted regulator of Ras-like GTPase activity (Roadblock/LC7/MglB family)